jgi:beta-lactamase regulating signal transducer with metallopeptidase domain
MSIEVSQAQLPSIILLFVLLVSVLIAIYFGVKSGDKYSVEDAQRDAVSFAGEVTEAEGPVTVFLKIAYIILIVWAVVYLALYL